MWSTLMAGRFTASAGNLLHRPWSAFGPRSGPGGRARARPPGQAPALAHPSLPWRPKRLFVNNSNLPQAEDGRGEAAQVRHNAHTRRTI